MASSSRPKGGSGTSATPRTKPRSTRAGDRGQPTRVKLSKVSVTPATVRTKGAQKRVLDAIVVNRQHAFRYAASHGNDQVLKLLVAAKADLEKRLLRVNPALVREGKFTPTAMRASLKQIEDLISQLVTPGVKKATISASRIAAALGNADAYKNLVAMDTRFAGIVSTGRLGVAMQLDPGLKKKRLAGRMFSKQISSTVLRRLGTLYPDVQPGKGIIERYGMETISAFEERMRIGMVTGKSWKEMRDDLTADSTWLQSTPLYWAQRIVRTESMGAYNRAILESGDEANKVVGGDMVKILVAGFDERTGWDSYQVHGQIRRLDEPFEWVTKKGETLSYMTPPNRPNDREVIVFHRLAWPIPEDLEPVSDELYEAAFERQNKNGSAPERPKMSTIPRSEFGKE